MKYLKTILVLTLLLSILTACGKTDDANRIPVTSTYPALESLAAGEYPYDEVDLLQDPDDPYRYCLCVVSEFRGNLVITDKVHYDHAVSGVSHVIRAGDYWGDETGVFHQDANGDNEVVTTEALVGFIPSYGEESLVAITGGVNGGTLHLLESAAFEESHPAVSFEGMPAAYSYTYTDKNYEPPQCFYIATDASLVRIDLGEYLTHAEPDISTVQIQSFAVPDYWEYLTVNSMCELDGILYMGTQRGVLAFDTVYYHYTYYPVDYETAVGEA